MIKAACLSSVGRVRGKNEDNFYFNGRYMQQNNNGTADAVLTFGLQNDEALLCVYDGMGGHEAGEVASYLAASETDKYIRQNNSASFLPCFLSDLALRLNTIIFDAGRGSLSSVPMGTTGVMLRFSGDEAFLCNVGDSPAFLWRDNALVKLSVDHVETLPSGCKNKPRLTQNLGMDPTEIRIEPYTDKFKTKSGDWYLLCSDGLTDMVGEPAICSVLEECASPKKAAEKLLQAALSNGGKDNITIILCKIK